MNYIQEIMKMLQEVDPEMSDEFARQYALLVLAKGEDTTMEDIHDAWSVVTDAVRPDHKSLVWFEDLSFEVQEYDRKYMDAVHAVARSL